MKRYGNLFDRIFTAENLHQAFKAAAKAKRRTRPCFDFEKHLGDNVAALLDEIHSGFYRPKPYYTFQVYEPKPRIIHAPAFRDRVVQHAIYRVVYPLFDRTFIDQSFACRVGYGTHKASLELQRQLQSCSGDDYYLQLDVRKFFYSINHNVLRGQIERTIKDGRLVDMMMLFAGDGPVGIPIGNLLSQLYALIYLNPMDHYIKRQMKIKNYVRYVDDFVLSGLTRPQCMAAKSQIEEILATELGLALSRSTVQKISRSVNFCGYRTWQKKRLVRKHSLYRFNRSIKTGQSEAVISLLGHAKNTATLPHFIQTIREHDHENLQLSARVRRLHHIPAGSGRR